MVPSSPEARRLPADPVRARPAIRARARRLLAAGAWTRTRPTLALARRPLLRRMLVVLLGRPVPCARCGERLFWGFAVVHDTGITLVGAERADVRIRFEAVDRLVLEHMYVGECRR